MARIDIFFASRDGQTRKIARVLAEALGQGGAGDVALIDLGGDAGAVEGGDVRVGQADFTVVVAPIRYGFPLPEADLFLRRHLDDIPSDRLAILLVCLLARKPDRQSAATNGYLRRWLRRRRAAPALAAAIAGKLNYPAYRWYDRWMMRLILRISGGPTDPTAVVEYTDWRQVSAISGQIRALCGEVGGRVAKYSSFNNKY